MPTIKIACTGADLLPIDSLLEFQGELKSLSKENYARLKKEIVDTGFAFPFHVWKSGDKLFLIGGHQRKRTLESMKEEGFEIPPLPVVYVEATDYKQAKRRVLQDVAQYGTVEKQGLYDFTLDADIKMEDLDASFVIPMIPLDMGSFNAEFFKDAPPSEEPIADADLQDDDDSGNAGEEEIDPDFADEIPDHIEPRVKPGESYKIGDHRVINGDCLKVLKTLPDNSVDSLVTDPPAGIGFMSSGDIEHWDSDKGGRHHWIAWLTDVMKECLRVMKPGAHGLVWSLPKTSHWTGTALEDAGFEVREKICHLFGSGFPKSLDISKQLDKMAGHWRGKSEGISSENSSMSGGNYLRTEKGDPITPAAAAAAAAGWGTALKPAFEPWYWITKPLNVVPEHDNFSLFTNVLEIWLCLNCPAKLAEKHLKLNPQDYKGAKLDSVRCLVVLVNIIQSEDLSELMDTFSSPETGLIYLSTVLLWKNILEENSKQESKSTIKTVLDQITGFRTLKSWILQSMQENTIQEEFLHYGVWLNATTAPLTLKDQFEKLKLIQTPIVQENAFLNLEKLVLSEFVKIAKENSLISLANQESFVHNSVQIDLIKKNNEAPLSKPDALIVLNNLITLHSDNQNIATPNVWPKDIKISPSSEYIILVRKPCSEDTVAENFKRWGTGGINIDKSRIGISSQDRTELENKASKEYIGVKPFGNNDSKGSALMPHTQGRFPSNLLLSHAEGCVEVGVKKVKGVTGGLNPHKEKSNTFVMKDQVPYFNYTSEDGTETVAAWECVEGECPIWLLDQQSGDCKTGGGGTTKRNGGLSTWGSHKDRETIGYADSGGASRFFKTFPPCHFIYVPKPSKREKNLGCEGLPLGEAPASARSKPAEGRENALGEARSNHHPTVKSTRLLSYLINMVTPSDGVILDCFGGSGTTLVAAHMQGFSTILIEQSCEYMDIILARAENSIEKSAILNSKIEIPL
jgi:DNA modification methylase